MFVSVTWPGVTGKKKKKDLPMGLLFELRQINQPPGCKQNRGKSNNNVAVLSADHYPSSQPHNNPFVLEVNP